MRVFSLGRVKIRRARSLLGSPVRWFTERIDAYGIDAQYGSCDKRDCEPYVYEAGTLLLDFVDTRTNRVVWRGWAEGSVDGMIDDQEWLEQRVDEAVRRILARLPRVS
jgi:hypothetical protein